MASRPKYKIVSEVTISVRFLISKNKMRLASTAAAAASN